MSSEIVRFSNGFEAYDFRVNRLLETDDVANLAEMDCEECGHPLPEHGEAGCHCGCTFWEIITDSLPSHASESGAVPHALTPFNAKDRSDEFYSEGRRKSDERLRDHLEFRSE